MRNFYTWLLNKRIEALTAIVGLVAGFLGGIVFIAWVIESNCKGNNAIVFDNHGMHHAIREEKETTKES